MVGNSLAAAAVAEKPVDYYWQQDCRTMYQKVERPAKESKKKIYNMFVYKYKKNNT